jgi:hypothetical protein
MEPFIIDVNPVEKEEYVLSTHEGEEFILILEGTMELVYGNFYITTLSFRITSTVIKVRKPKSWRLSIHRYNIGEDTTTHNKRDKLSRDTVYIIGIRSY